MIACTNPAAYHMGWMCEYSPAILYSLNPPLKSLHRMLIEDYP